MRHHAKTGNHSWMGILAVSLALCSFAPGVAAQSATTTEAPQVRDLAAPASLDPVLKELATWDSGLDSAAVWKLRAYVQAHKDDAAGRAECETKLVGFLKTNATPAAKIVAARWLRVVGSEQGVPALEALLLDPRSSDVALYALQRIPGAVVDQALIRALAKATGAMKIALVGALGQRRSADAVAVLTPMFGRPDLARAAAVALGAIGTDAAAQSLVAAYPRAQADLKSAVGSSILQCAERDLAAGNGEAALRLYDVLMADATLQKPLRRAAALGRIAASGPAATKTLMAYLDGSDAVLQEAAISRVAGVIAPDAVAPVCAMLPRLPEGAQLQLLPVLAGYPGERVRPAILDAARSTSAPVRVAAINALQSAGDASAVPLLVETAARARGDEQAAARTALAMLKGRGVDEAILKMVTQAPSEGAQAELLLSIGDRRIFPAKDVVAASLASPSSRVRLQALRSLRAIGTPSDIPAMLAFLMKTDDEGERTEAEKTTAVLAEKIANPDGRASAIRTRLMRESDPAVRAKLLAVLPLFGDNSTLPLLRASLGDANATVTDAAVRALAAWPTSAAREDVFAVARDSKNETHRLLAVRGLVRMIALDRYRPPKAAVADLRQAASFSPRPDEQRLVLGALAEFPSQEALDMATEFLDKPDVKAEAQAAIERIKARLSGRGRRGT